MLEIALFLAIVAIPMLGLMWWLDKLIKTLATERTPAQLRTTRI
jgi:hypothetical protein